MKPAYAAQSRNGRGAAAPQLCGNPACLIKITSTKNEWDAKKVRHSFDTGGCVSKQKNGPGKAGAGQGSNGFALPPFQHVTQASPHGGHQACHGGFSSSAFKLAGQTRFALPGGIIFLPQQGKLLRPARCKQACCFAKLRLPPAGAACPLQAGTLLCKTAEHSIAKKHGRRGACKLPFRQEWRFLTRPWLRPGR